MIKITSFPTIAAALLACGLAAAPAQAGPNRTFVSGLETDSGACSRTAPCRTFAFALSVTTAGGEINVLDTAGYGPVTIIHAISIVNDGAGTADITTGSGNAITVNAVTSDSVHLRGLTIEGISGASTGILFNSGGNLAIENCVVRGFAFAGIAIAPSASSSFTVSNTIASNNAASGSRSSPPDRRSSPACSAKSPRIIISTESLCMVAGRPGHRSMSPLSIARLPTTPVSASWPSRCPAPRPPLSWRAM